MIDISDLNLLNRLGSRISTFKKEPLTPILVNVFRQNIAVTKRRKRNIISNRNAERDFWIVLDCNSGKTLKEIGAKYKLTPANISIILYKQIRMARHPNRWPTEEWEQYVKERKTKQLLEK